MVARHFTDTWRISPEGRTSVAHRPSRLVRRAPAPAERHSPPPLPGSNSMLCKVRPVGMCLSGMQLPGVGSMASAELTTASPTVRPCGARMYRLVPSAYCSSAIWQVRLGSYSMPITVAGMSSLVRRKSMTRYRRLCPWPRPRTVILPWLFRPPVLGSGRSRDFSGRSLVTSVWRLTEAWRRALVVGL